LLCEQTMRAAFVVKLKYPCPDPIEPAKFNAAHT
jgi:hypothetical protein